MFEFYHKIFGYYTLKIPSEKGTQLLNRLNENKIYFFDALPKGDFMYLKASLFSCARILDEAVMCEAECEVISGSGLPFFLHRYRKRVGIYVGLFLSCVLLLYSQMFVWKIVISSGGVSEGVILEALRDNGIYEGAFIPDIRVINSELRISRETDEISSIAINIRGTTAEVHVLKRVHPPELAETGGYGNIVASENGKIVQIQASRGQPTVAVGEEVKAGQLLISGDVLTKTGLTYRTLASGNVFAAVNRPYTITVPLSLTEKHYTGRTYMYKSLTFLGHTLFASDICDFKLYDAEVSDERIYIMGLDTALRHEYALCREYEYSTVPISVAEAKKRCIDAFRQYLKSAEYEVYDYNYTVYYNEKKGVCTLMADARFIENIAWTVKSDPDMPSAD